MGILYFGPSKNYNTDAGVDVVFDLFTGQRTQLPCLCVCVPTQKSCVHELNVQVEVTVNTRPVNKSKTTSTPGICVSCNVSMTLSHYLIT